MMKGGDIPNNAQTKTLKIGARVTPEQKQAVREQMEEAGFEKESEYVLYCCLQKDAKFSSPYQFENLQRSDKNRLNVRVTKEEKEKIMKRYEASKASSFSRFVRNCCLDKPIVVIAELSEFAKQLSKIGNNLNQLTMLCHQGVISNPDISEASDCLKQIYKEVTSLQKKYRLGR